MVAGLLMQSDGDGRVYSVSARTGGVGEWTNANAMESGPLSSKFPSFCLAS